MARRRHGQEEDDSSEEVFKYPDFDRAEYIKEEINRSKAAIVPVVLGSVVGILCAYLFLKIGGTYAWPLSFIIGMSAFVGVKFLYPLAGVDVKKLRKKDYVGHAVMYFFAWLAIFIIFLNPPFADYSAPHIDNVHLEGYDENGNWTTYEQGGNYSEYRIVAMVYDNTEVAVVEMSINGGEWQVMPKTSDGLGYALPVDYSGTGSITYQIRATDIFGHEIVESGTLPQ